MPLPLITENMYFDTVLKAIEATLKAESLNQISLDGTGWKTVRERFDPWNVETDEFNPGVVNVVWNTSNFDDTESTAFNQKGPVRYTIDMYASEKGLNSGGVITPKDQRAADILHTLITKVYYTLSSPINYDLGLVPGTIVKPFVTDIVKFVPVENNVPINGIIAARMTCRIKFEETPPEKIGVPLNDINIKTSTTHGGLTDQTITL